MSFIIRLQNLSRSAKSTDIRSFFDSLSIPNGSVCIVGSNEAFIGFSTDEDARQAMLRDGGQLCGNTVRLSLSSRKEMSDAMKRAQDLRQVLKGLEDAIRSDSLSEEAIKSVRNILDNGADALERISQPSSSLTLNDQLTISSSVAIANRQTTPPADSNGSWKDFLASALKTIENANDGTDQNSQLERIPGPSQAKYPYPQSRPSLPNFVPHIQDRPAQPNLRQQPTGRPSQPNIIQHFQNPTFRNNGSVETASRQSHFVGNDNVEPLSRPQQIPHFMPPKESGGIRREPMSMDADELLRQQQLAAVKNMDVPTVQQNYDPEELFVELSRLPPNLLDLRALKDFLSPVIPREARVSAENGVHINTVLYCGNKRDSFAIMKRDGEFGIRIRWSNRSTFFALPPVSDGGLWCTMQNNWRTEDQIKRPNADWTDQRPPKRSHWDTPESTGKLESWLNPNSRFDETHFLLLTSVPYRATTRDIQMYAAELGVTLKSSVQIFENDADRSDAWVMEFPTSMDIRTVISAAKPMLGRRLKFERLSPEAAAEMAQNGTKSSSWPQRTSRNPVPHIPQPSTSNMAPTSSQRGGFFNSAPFLPRRNIHSDNNSTPYFSNGGNRAVEAEPSGSMNWGMEQHQFHDDDHSSGVFISLSSLFNDEGNTFYAVFADGDQCAPFSLAQMDDEEIPLLSGSLPTLPNHSLHQHHHHHHSYGSRSVAGDKPHRNENIRKPRNGSTPECEMAKSDAE